MLVLSRQRDESILIILRDVTPEDLDLLLRGEPIVLTTVDIRGDKVRHGVEAPKSVRVDRSEVWKSRRREERQARERESLAAAK